MTGLNSHTHLFVDDASNALVQGATRRVVAGAKLAEPVIAGREPWQDEGADGRVYVYGTALQDSQAGYRLWYMRYHSDVLCATSVDGIVWDRPALGLAHREHERVGNRLPLELHSPSVVCDETSADEAQRYKMLGYRRGQERRGYWAAHSADGLHWDYYVQNPVLEGGDTCTLSHDPEAGEYLAFHKLTHEYRGHVRRLVYLSTSPDMQTWSEPRLVLAPDEEDDDLVRSRGGLCAQFYNMSAFRYGELWLGMATHFGLMQELSETGPNQSAHDGPIEAQLVHSRDGRTWHRCSDRSPIIARGPGEYDAGCILGVANQPVLTGDEMWMFYTGINTTHGGAMPPKRVSVARATWPRDRWVSLDADPKGAVAETVPLHLDDGEVEVNADAEAGEVRVEVMDAGGMVLPGFEAASCQAIRGDHLRHRVRWSGGRNAPVDRPVRLRFLWESARLFSWIAALSGPPSATSSGPSGAMP